MRAPGADWKGDYHAHKYLPFNPNLRQLRIQAKELNKARRSGDSNALSRIRKFHPRYADASNEVLQAVGLTLSDAQHVLARDAAFLTWEQAMQRYEQCEGIKSQIREWSENANAKDQTSLDKLSSLFPGSI